MVLFNNKQLCPPIKESVLVDKRNYSPAQYIQITYRGRKKLSLVLNLQQIDKNIHESFILF